MRVKRDTRLYDINDKLERLDEEYDENRKSKAYHTKHNKAVAALNEEFAETLKEIEKEYKGF